MKALKFVLNDYKPSLSDEEIIGDIKFVAKQLNVDYISIATYKKNGRYSQTAIQSHFGTWKNALRLAGLRTERNSLELKKIKDEDYIKDLIRVAKLCNKDTVTYADYKKYGRYSVEHIFKRFSSWDDVLQIARLKPTGMAHHKVSEQELLEEIERMWITLGRQPTSTDIIKNGVSKYSIDTYKRRFGGWRKALEAFVEWINSTGDLHQQESPDFNMHTNTSQANNCDVEPHSICNPTINSKKAPQHKTHRNINLRLRFKVMQRDNFSCVLCGASPAKNKNIVLHVDHIIPWAKGGETELDNLQTLCSNCNLGKSDLDI